VEEVDGLRALPADRQAAGFMRLWTLKEAFIKATGEGLTRDLASFWFQPVPPRIHFVESRTEQPDHWHFDQRVIGQRFIGAIGLRRIAGAPVTTDWIDIDASRFDPSAADQGNGEPLLRTLL
jgi:4'-phosphopantetheinyl transferase